jgi:hypothetical protein
MLISRSARLTLAISLISAAAPVVAAPLPYADLADLTLAAPVIVRATITRTQRISPRDAPGLAAGKARLLVTATVDAALVAPGTVPATMQWLWDAPLDSRGKPPKPKNEPVLAWVAAPDALGNTRLVGGAGQRPWDVDVEAMVRKIATDARSGTVPSFTGVTNGFHVDGTVRGESESQFFLKTAAGNSVTMVVTTRPGQPRRVAIARGDVIDESATVVRPDTFLKYRLACFLPKNLPPSAGDGNPALDADWRAALIAIGPCGRTL